MSCARCGSDNTEGSRFCGVCGDKLAPAAAPALEVEVDSDAARADEPDEAVETVAAAPPRSAVVGRAPSPFDPSEPSIRMPAAGGGGRAIAIALLLLVDVGLATAGALFLKAGLAGQVGAATPALVIDAGGGAEDGVVMREDGGAGPGTGDVAVASGGDGRHGTTPIPTGTGTGTGVGTGAGTAGTGAGTGTGTGSVDDVVTGIFGKRDAGVAPIAVDAAVAVVVRTPDAAAAAPPPPPMVDAAVTLDPYASPDAALPPAEPDAAQVVDDDPRTVDLASEVDRKSAQGQSKFNHCYEDAAKAYTPDQPLAGEVDIAFRVMPTGEVQNVAAVRNTTGSDKLADCLIAVIAAWSFSPSQLAEPAVFVRPFRFDGH
jgi:hypothetical protein